MQSYLDVQLPSDASDELGCGFQEIVFKVGKEEHIGA